MEKIDYIKVKTYGETVPQSKFEIRFNYVRNNQMEEKEILKEDFTQKFYDEVINIYNFKELINIAVIGKVARGKSTVAIALCYWIRHNLLMKKMNVRHILDDQISYQRTIKDIKLNNECHVIDEDNRLSRTGVNSTMETTQLQSFSEIQAQRFLHRIYCSPSNIEDVETPIILEVISADKVQMFTRCKLYYRMNTPIGTITQVLGYVDIDVLEVIKQEFYEQYRKMKFKKMDLMNAHGINDRRTMDFAEIILNAYNEWKEVAKYKRITESVINSIIKVEQVKKGFNLSLLAKDELKQDIYVLLSLVYSINTESTKKDIDEKVVRLMQDKLNELINHYKMIVKVYNEFLNISV